ncbi:OmpA family protein [Flavihumibacter profundi]|jgi:outer membrane protein OmpA-like peptidoglycan-associated protein/tetratricopeptide (TPR) repeat protein|uniref:OmpA family protein n=1 Tax=Flavihumibacter profundi TaxID=2716883 RepID=UPI001CC34D56|nr:OmpA family protein [Flavihumibacter profundi]MBZ5857128.1 OmpA family protein [Flavihumibacter profundi]
MQKHIIPILFFFLLTSPIFAQVYKPEKVSPKAVKLYQEGIQLAENNLFREGIAKLQQAVGIYPGYADAWLSIAGMYGELKDYDNSILNYQKAEAIDSDYFRDYNLPYSINLAGKGRFEDALHAVNRFMTVNNLNEASQRAAAYRRRCYQFAIDQAKNPDIANYMFSPVNLGDSVNSAVSEYYPALTIDNQQLIFTRRVNNYNEDFYETRRNGNNWSAARGLTGMINSNLNEGAQSISQDGEWLIFTGCNFPEGMGSCDLYISYLTPDGWSEPENLGNKINTDAWESAPSLSPDKRDLYFASRRPDGYGGSDIYVSHLLPGGRWSEPENLGPEINTSGDESCPFIHADNQSLYFTSNGLTGYGGDDLFMARKGPKGSFSLPRNLGYPINTIENEGSLVITADGSTAYYASDRSDSRGGLDLYTFTMRPDVRPIKTLWVKGRVLDAKTSKGLPSAVELTDISTRQLVSRIQTDETGNYLITLPVGRDYAFNVNRKGYLIYSENFPLSEKAPDSTYHIDIPLQPLTANATVVLKNIFFDINSTNLGNNSAAELDQLVHLLKENPTLQIQINGHTDNVGKAADNLTLSNGRAQSVVAYLIKSGIDAKRLRFKGFGATQPIADNTTEEGRASNRRTELKVVAD